MRRLWGHRSVGTGQPSEGKGQVPVGGGHGPVGSMKNTHRRGSGAGLPIVCACRKGRCAASVDVWRLSPFYFYTFPAFSTWKRKKVVGAELRGINDLRRHGMTPGSRKDLGCFYVKYDWNEILVLKYKKS